MGAYENPKSYITDYSAGVKAFTSTFNQGIKAGVQMGEQLIAERGAYEDSVYEQGKEMEKELNAAVENGEKTKVQINEALESFYDEALKVEQPTKKGLGGLFSMPTENRLDAKGLREAQNSFEGAVKPINTVLDYVYTSDIDINQDENRGHELYDQKKLIHDKIKSGKAKPTFGYNKDSKKFESYIEIDGEKISPQKLETIFSASGKEERIAIDEKKDLHIKSNKNKILSKLKNAESTLEFGNKLGYVEAETMARNSIFSDTANTNIDLNNDIYNNHVNLPQSEVLKIFKKQPSFVGMSDEKILEIADLPLKIGVKKIQQNLNIPEGDALKVYNESVKAKNEVVNEYTFQQMKNEGLLDQYNRPTVDKNQNRGSGRGGSSDSDKYILDKNNMINFLFDSTQGAAAAAKSQRDAIMNNPNLSQAEKTNKTHKLLGDLMGVSGKDQTYTHEMGAQALRNIGVRAHSKQEVLKLIGNEEERARIESLPYEMYQLTADNQFVSFASYSGKLEGNSIIDKLFRVYGETMKSGQLKDYNKDYEKSFNLPRNTQ